MRRKKDAYSDLEYHRGKRSGKEKGPYQCGHRGDLKSLDAPVQSVRVIINEMPKENYAIAGELICDREAAKH